MMVSTFLDKYNSDHLRLENRRKTKKNLLENREKYAKMKMENREKRRSR